MKITRLRIRNFRSIQDLDITLDDATVFIGANNAGKTAIVDAVRIALTRRWGQRGTGFTENDVYRPDDKGCDPKSLPPVQIEIVVSEPVLGAWDPDMVADLDDILALHADGRNFAWLRVTCAWNEEKDAFEPSWQFLDAAGSPLTGRSQRATNMSGFFGYLPFFWLGALRDAADEFAPRSVHWGKLLRGVRIPDSLEAEAMETLAKLDAKIIGADPRFSELAGVIGQATHVAAGDGPGGARLNALPLTVEDMLQRAGIVLQHEGLRPWLPLGQHGQGLQSLAVMFLFQAAVRQQLSDAARPNVGAIFAIEEPEVHLHPQAARTLWQRIEALPGQRLVTTHSPYFLQHVPLHSLRLVRLRKGRTEVASLPRCAISELPWSDAIDKMAEHTKVFPFAKDPASGCVSATSWFDEKAMEALTACYRKDVEFNARIGEVARLRCESRLLISEDDEESLSFHGRRVRGEVFFARYWVLVEGVCEYMLLHAIGAALGKPLDAHGAAVIDFQQSGSPGVYAALAEAFGIPWAMIVDGDDAGARFRNQVLERGFEEEALDSKIRTLAEAGLEAQLLADGHEALVREALADVCGTAARTCPPSDLKVLLRNNKTAFMSGFARRVSVDRELALRMPSAFVEAVNRLTDSAT